MKEAFELIKKKLTEVMTVEQQYRGKMLKEEEYIEANMSHHRIMGFNEALSIVSEVEAEYGNGKTNADRIRAMSDEELAEWLHNITQFDGDDGELMISIYNLDSEKDEDIRDSYGDLLEWLKSPTTD